jgi:uncharacterized membrane protein
MGGLIAGLILFFGVHVLSSARPARQALVERMGEKRYKGIYSLISLIGFALMVVGMSKAPRLELWTPPEWGYYAAVWFMPVALISLAASIVPSNIRRMTAHPMLWGFTLWALLHLLANGDLASLLLFGAFGLYSVHAMSSQNARGARIADRRRSPGFDVAAIAVGLALYWLLLRFHGKLFGVSVLYS